LTASESRLFVFFFPSTQLLGALYLVHPNRLLQWSPVGAFLTHLARHPVPRYVAEPYFFFFFIPIRFPFFQLPPVLLSSTVFHPFVRFLLPHHSSFFPLRGLTPTTRFARPSPVCPRPRHFPPFFFLLLSPFLFYADFSYDF